MVTSDFQYVVPMVGRLRFGGRLGPSFVLGLLPHGGYCGDAASCLGESGQPRRIVRGVGGCGGSDGSVSCALP